MELSMYIMEPEPMSMAYFLNPPISPCVSLFILHTIARQRLGNHVPETTNTRSNGRIV
jgi:hypothetical protein